MLSHDSPQWRELRAYARGLCAGRRASRHDFAHAALVMQTVQTEAVCEVILQRLGVRPRKAWVIFDQARTEARLALRCRDNTWEVRARAACVLRAQLLRSVKKLSATTPSR